MAVELPTTTELSDKELALLGLVAEEPCHAYRLQGKIRERSMERWTLLSLSSVYRVLCGLEKKGLIDTRLEHEGQGPTRKVHELTAAGAVALGKAVLQRLSSSSGPPSPLQVALANVAFVDPLEAAEALKARAQGLQETRSLLRRHCRELLGADRVEYLRPTGLPADSPVRMSAQATLTVSLVLEWTRCRLEAEQRFGERAREALLELAGASHATGGPSADADKAEASARQGAATVPPRAATQGE